MIWNIMQLYTFSLNFVKLLSYEKWLKHRYSPKWTHISNEKILEKFISNFIQPKTVSWNVWKYSQISTDSLCKLKTCKNFPKMYTSSVSLKNKSDEWHLKLYTTPYVYLKPAQTFVAQENKKLKHTRVFKRTNSRETSERIVRVA